MFYLILAIIVILIYSFMAPKSVQSTMNLIVLMAAVAFLIILGIGSVIQLIQSPPEIFVGLLVSVLGFFALRDILYLQAKPKSPLLEKLSIKTLIKGLRQS